VATIIATDPLKGHRLKYLEWTHMASGIRATVRIDDADACPIATFAAETGTRIDQVSTSVAAGTANATTEFLAATDTPSEDEIEGPIFSYGELNLYRREHDGEASCPCACLGEFGCPVHRYVIEDGAITLVFHAAEFEQLQEIMATFRDRYPGVDVQQLLHPPLEGDHDQRVFVNRGKLTDRQHEVLKDAYEAGYFERPREANATELAAELGISQSTFTEHLVAAQRKLFADVLADDS